MSRPHICQADRDALDDRGLTDVLDRTDDPKLLHAEEPTPT
jgi:hypothetical protein